MRFTAWKVHRSREPMVREEVEAIPEDDDVLVRVAGCGVCHTDLGYFYDGVPTRHPFPLVLGHEISGTVVEAGSSADEWLGRDVVVPAVIPCGRCAACLAGRGAVCPHQIFPGNDVDGGFATHVKVPARGLCAIPDLHDLGVNPAGVDLETLAVVADAVSTPYQAISRSGLEPGDLAVFVGAGGVGGFGVQIAAALGGEVVAIDVDPERLEPLSRYGASATFQAGATDAKTLKAAVRAFADERGIPSFRHKIFETSGTTSGQATAFSLLGPGGYLGVVGFTPEKLELRLSNLMAFDAIAQGNWGCLPELYPAVVDLVLSGQVAVEPFIEKRPLDTINDTFHALHRKEMRVRPVLVTEA